MNKTIALAFAASVLLLPGCCTTSHSAKWEYKQVEQASDEQLNQLADQGWIVVCATTSTRSAPVYLLKRCKH
jgi:protein involved in sex pheromone biosynthesis